MNKFIEAAQPHLPLMIYTLIAFAAVMLVVSVVKIFLRKRTERLRALARQNNVLFSRLLTPNELDERDPVITQQQAKGPILRGGRRPMLSDNGPAVDLSMFNNRTENAEPARPLPQGLGVTDSMALGAERSPIMKHQSINAAVVKDVSIIGEFEPLNEQIGDIQTENSNHASSVHQPLEMTSTAVQPIGSEGADVVVSEASYEKILVLSQREYHFFERLLDRLETFHSGQGFMLLNNVRLGRFVRTDNTNAINLINHKSVDFVIINSQCKAVAVIQCQDRQAQEKAVIKEICVKAGIEYFELNDEYDTSVMNQISKVLNLNEHQERNIA